VMSKILSTRMPQDDVDQIYEIADRHNSSVGMVLRVLIKEGLSAYQAQQNDQAQAPRRARAKRATA
jgi:hypothetical protein